VPADDLPVSEHRRRRSFCWPAFLVSRIGVVTGSEVAGTDGRAKWWWWWATVTDSTGKRELSIRRPGVNTKPGLIELKL
jgi:hypothetical protein